MIDAGSSEAHWLTGHLWTISVEQHFLHCVCVPVHYIRACRIPPRSVRPGYGWVSYTSRIRNSVFLPI